MAPDLAAALAGQTPLAEESVVWGKGGATPLPLRIAGYLGAEAPPPAYVTSVRALVFRGEALLALPEPGATHILPGGRREGDEAPEATLRREVLEESGWALGTVSPLGFMHYRNLGPRRPQPAGDPYRYPYPDFLNLVFLAEADTFDPAALLPNEYEREPYTLRPIAEVRAATLTPIARAYLEVALRAHS